MPLETVKKLHIAGDLRGPQGNPGPTGPRGSSWFLGVTITGMNQNGTIFPDSGIEEALVNDNYLNTETGAVYTCTVGGQSDIAEWSYKADAQDTLGVTLAVEAIREIAERAERLAEGAKRAIPFDTVDEMNEWLTVPENVEYLRIGDNFFIRDTDVPDYWWDGENPIELEAKTDLSDYIKNTDYATATKAGVLKAGYNIYGLLMLGSGEIAINPATNTEIDEKSTNMRKPITPSNLDYAVKKALADSKLAETVDAWTDEEKAAARLLLGAVGSEDYASSNKAGVAKFTANYGLGVKQTDGYANVVSATEEEIDAKTQKHKPIVPKNLDYAVKIGLTTNTIDLTAEEQAAAKDWLGVNDVMAIEGESIIIWDTEPGLYKIVEGCKIYYDTSNLSKYYTTICKGLLYIIENVTSQDVAVKIWYLTSKINAVPCLVGGCVSETSGAKYETPGFCHIPDAGRTTYINGAWTFNVQPTTVADLAVDDNSTNIPNTQWVQGAIEAALQARGL